MTPLLLLALLLLLLPASPSTAAATSFYVRFDLEGKGVSKGSGFTVKVEPSWAPLGAAHFEKLVKRGFYDDTRFFRVLDGDYGIYIAQFGMHGTPGMNDDTVIRDDPFQPGVHSNVRGTLAFAHAGPHSRTSQIFLNFGDSSKVLDGDFVPFAHVVDGLSAIDAIHKVGEGAPSGKGPSQSDISKYGNAFLDEQFPDLTEITAATIIEFDEDREL